MEEVILRLEKEIADIRATDKVPVKKPIDFWASNTKFHCNKCTKYFYYLSELTKHQVHHNYPRVSRLR